MGRDDELMNEKHDMPKLDGKEREVVLNYLESGLSARACRNVAGRIRFSIGDVSMPR